MSTTAARKLADTALQLFPTYRWDDEQQANWLDALLPKISHFDDEIIERAISDMVGTRDPNKKRGTPSVAECIGYCTEAKRWLDLQQNKGRLPVGEDALGIYGPDRTKERYELANQIALNPHDPMCIQAAKDGWIGTLHEFARKHRRMPEATKRVEYRKSKKSAVEMVSEIDWCKREARDCDEASKQVEKLLARARSDDERNRFRALAEMYADMKAKRLMKANQVLRGARGAA